MAKRFEYPSPFIVGSIRTFAKIVSKLCWFVRYHGIENIPDVENGSFIIVSNHATYLDPAWITLPISHPLRFMAWEQAFEWPIIGKLIHYLGAFPVNTEAKVTKTAIVESLRTLRSGGVLVIFPEGEREMADGKFLEFKTGALYIALRAGVPVLPVSIHGGNKVWPQGQKYPRLFRSVDITYHAPISLSDCANTTETDECLERMNEELISVIASAA